MFIKSSCSKPFKIGLNVNAIRYNPKFNFIYLKIIYSPFWKLLKRKFDKEQLILKLKKNFKKKIKK